MNPADGTHAHMGQGGAPIRLGAAPAGDSTGRGGRGGELRTRVGKQWNRHAVWKILERHEDREEARAEAQG